MRKESTDIQDVSQSHDDAAILLPKSGKKVFVIYSDFKGGANRLRQYILRAEESRGSDFWERNLDESIEVFGRASEDPERQTILSAVEYAEDFEQPVLLGYDLSETFKNNPLINFIDRMEFRKYILLEKAKMGGDEQNWESLDGYVEFMSAMLPLNPNALSIAILLNNHDYVELPPKKMVRKLLTEGASQAEVASHLGLSWLKMHSIKRQLRAADKKRRREELDSSCGAERSPDYGWYKWSWNWDSDN